jgi:hypothetical protein
MMTTDRPGLLSRFFLRAAGADRPEGPPIDILNLLTVVFDARD